MGLAKLAGDILLTTKKYSPEIKFILGVVSLGAALYTTHKAALKSDEILEKRKERLKKVDEAKEMVENGEVEEGVTYTEADIKSDIRKINLSFAIDLGKNYALPALFTGLTIASFAGAMGDYKKLFIGMGAAYNAVVMKYNDEMKFFKDQLGEEKFNDLQEGFKTEQIRKAQSTGLKDPEAKWQARSKNNPYSRFFDELHGCWTENPETNKTWLIGKENMLEERLQRNGHLFLNDAYEEMGYPPTDAGRVMGWIRDNPDGTTNHVDFGIFDVHDEASRWFVNGLEPIFLINFNVDPKPITGRIGWASY